jgi:hypothetical protein
MQVKARKELVMRQVNVTAAERVYLERGNGIVTKNNGLMPVRSLAAKGLVETNEDKAWNDQLGRTELFYAINAAGIRWVKEDTRRDAEAQCVLRG